MGYFDKCNNLGGDFGEAKIFSNFSYYYHVSFFFICI